MSVLDTVLLSMATPLRNALSAPKHTQGHLRSHNTINYLHSFNCMNRTGAAVLLGLVPSFMQEVVPQLDMSEKAVPPPRAFQGELGEPCSLVVSMPCLSHMQCRRARNCCE